MKKAFYIFFFISLLTGCGEKKNEKENVTFNDIKKQAEETANTTADYLKQGSEDLRREFNEKLNKLDKEIEDLKARKGVTDKDFKRRVNELEDKRDELKDKLDKAKDNAGENWREFKQQANETFEEIQRKIDSLKK